MTPDEHMNEAVRLINESPRDGRVTFDDLLEAARAAAATSVDDYPWALDLIARAEAQGISREVTAMAVKTALTTTIVAPEVLRTLTGDRAAYWTDEDPLLAASKAMTFAMGAVVQGAMEVMEHSPIIGLALRSFMPTLVGPGLGVAAMLAQQAHERRTGG